MVQIHLPQPKDVFHQFSKKIIALVTIVCLLVGMMVVPSAATGEVQMYSYNGVVLPALPEYDSETYEAAIFEYVLIPGYYFLVLQEIDYGFSQYEEVEDGYTWDFCNDEETVPLLAYRFRREYSGDWQSIQTSLLIDMPLAPVWTNTPYEGFFDIDGNLLLASSEPVPVISSGDDSTGDSTDAAMYSYNGVQLPALPDRDKEKRPYAFMVEASVGDVSYIALYIVNRVAEYGVLAVAPSYGSCVHILSPFALECYVYTYSQEDADTLENLIGSGTEIEANKWSLLVSESSEIDPHVISGYVFWSSHNITDIDANTVYLAASDPVPVGGIPEPDIPDGSVESPVMDILSTTADSSSITTDFSISGTSADSRYTIKASCFSGNQVVSSNVSGIYSGAEFAASVSVGGLSPSTEYSVRYELSKDGEYTGVSQTVTVTTAAASGSGSDDGTGDGTDDSGSCACPSILNSILSAITTQTNFLSTWQQTWTTRMDSFESTLSKLIPVPDPTETALKESVKETTQAVVDKVFADDSATKVTASDIGDMADSGKEVVNAFDTGTTVGDFFSVFTDYAFTGWFSEETRANLDSVNSVSTFRLDDDPYNHDSYNKNMEALDKFLERSGKVND